MKSISVATLFVLMILAVGFTSCSKKEEVASSQAEVNLSGLGDVSSEVSPEVSSVASQKVEGKKFVRKADVNLDVADVYQATILIEKTLLEMGGFVSSSDYNSFVRDEYEYPQSETKTLLVREYSAENRMQVRVPTERLADFLKALNDNTLFLHHRTITATDVSANIKMTQLERKRIQNQKDKLSKQVNTNKTAEAINNNDREGNAQEIEQINLADELKYSTVEIYIKEPKTRISKIEIPNTKSEEKQYKISLWYEVKDAFSDGFYLFQRFLVAIVNAWLFILVAFGLFFIYKKRKTRFSKGKENK